MKTILARFAQAKRGAVAMIFALMLLPLVLFVALAIDYSFFAEARSQIQLAADAAVTHAIRAAASTYSLEINAGISDANGQVTTDARNAGFTAGQNWFVAELGALPTAYIPAGAVGGENPNIDVEATTNPTGFSAGVRYQGNYPPFFDAVAGGPPGTHLFASTSNWYITGTSSAQTQYSYVEIMMLLDISQSMLIGATPADINTMSVNTVCPNQNWLASTAGDSPLNDDLGGVNSDLTYEANAADGDQITNWAQQSTSNPNGIPNYVAGPNTAANYPYNGTCATGYRVPGFYQAANAGRGFLGNLGYAGDPCGLACHNSSGTYQGYSTDLYGIARRLGATLRLDVVFQATEQVIQSMIATEAVANQFSIGLYGFNTDVKVLTTGTQGSTTNGDASQEATYNLNSVLQAVYGIDYSHAPETSFPPVDTVDDGNTNFVTSMADLYKGNATGGTALKASGSGSTSTAPIKDLFIVTDGQEDECCNGNRLMGEMASYLVENGGTATNPLTHATLGTVCQQFKNPVSKGGLGYTIYVLYIDYDAVPTISYYYQPFGSDTDGYFNADFSNLTNTSERNMTLPPSTSGAAVTPVNASYPNDSPNESGLRACASPGDLYEAKDSASIASQLSLILKSALASAIRVTN